VAVGHAHTCAYSRNYTLKCWGSNQYGQCNIPTEVQGLSANVNDNDNVNVNNINNIIYIDSGYFSTCVLDE